jgi:hypothetical protein
MSKNIHCGTAHLYFRKSTLVMSSQNIL